MPVLPTVRVTPTGERSDQPVFYYDLGDPMCYLVAERVSAALPVVPEWEPVLGAAVTRPAASLNVEEITRRVRDLGLQPLRWPEAWPVDSRQAMLAATYAKRIGRAVAFSLAAFRQAFAAGRDLADRDTVLIAGAACEIHPSALLRALATRSVTEALEQATNRARQAGIETLPAIQISDRIFSGEHAITEATRALR